MRIRATHHEPRSPPFSWRRTASTSKRFASIAHEGGIEDLYPLTPVQEGMLFHTLADPESGHYVEQFVCRLRGELDPAALEKSWHRLIGRHHALRLRSIGAVSTGVIRLSIAKPTMPSITRTGEG